MEIIILWIALCVVVSVYASRKGHNPAFIFFISIILSPLLGFLITLIRGAKREVIERKSIAKGDQKKCPYCAELVKYEALVCKHCGAEIGSTPSESSKINEDKASDGIEW